MLRGYRLKNGDYTPMMGASLKSDVLGLELRVENGRLRLYDPKTGKRLLTHKEAQAARRAAEAKAEMLEAENARLRDKLARLQSKKD